MNVDSCNIKQIYGVKCKRYTIDKKLSQNPFNFGVGYINYRKFIKDKKFVFGIIIDDYLYINEWFKIPASLATRYYTKKELNSILQETEF